MLLSNKKPLRNIVLFGSTGSGKSSTCNTLFGKDSPFTVGDDSTSCTEYVISHIQAEKGIKIIDTPGYSDTKFNEKRNHDIIEEFFGAVLDPKVKSTNQIDAFLLVAKLNPRPQTLKADLERIRNTFGSIAMKSLILVLIFENGNGDYSSFMPRFIKMEEITRIIAEGKQEKPNEDWICIWDNINPRPEQERELFAKISKLEPYTCQKFIGAVKEVRERLDAQAKAELDRQIARVKKDFEDDSEAQQKEIARLQAVHEKEKKELFEAREKANKVAFNFACQIEGMKEENKREIEALYERMAKEGAENLDRIKNMIIETENAYNQHQNVQKAALSSYTEQSSAKQPEIVIQREEEDVKKQEREQYFLKNFNKIQNPGEGVQDQHMEIMGSEFRGSNQSSLGTGYDDVLKPREPSNSDAMETEADGANSFIKMMQETQKNLRKEREQLFEQTSKENEEDFNKLAKEVQKSQEESQRKMNELLRQQEEIQRDYKARIEAANHKDERFQYGYQNRNDGQYVMGQQYGAQNQFMPSYQPYQNNYYSTSSVQPRGYDSINNDSSDLMRKMKETDQSMKREREQLYEESMRQNQEDINYFSRMLQKNQEENQRKINELRRQQEEAMEYQRQMEQMMMQEKDKKGAKGKKTENRIPNNQPQDKSLIDTVFGFLGFPKR